MNPLALLRTYASTLLAVFGLIGWMAAGWQTVRVSTNVAALAKEQRARAQEHAQAEEQARITSENYRREEARRAAATQEAIDHAEQEAARARADLAIADAAAGRLRQRVAALVAADREAASHPATPPPGPPAQDAAGMFADVLGRCITRVQLLADLADQRGAAGTACERIHHELTAAP